MGRSFNQGGGAQSFTGGELLETFVCNVINANLPNLNQSQDGFKTASVLLLNASAPVTIDSLAGASDKRSLILLVAAGSSTITFAHSSGAGVANELFVFGADLALSATQSVQLLANTAAGGWVIVGAAPASGGGGAPVDSTFVTATNETATLPDSVQLGALAPAGTAQGARVYLTALFAVGAATEVPVIWDAEDFDTSDFWNAGAPTVFTAPQAGLYLLSASLIWNNAASEFNYVTFQKNASANCYGFSSQINIGNGGNQFAGTALSTLMNLAQGDTVKLIAWNQAGGNVQATALPGSPSFMSIHLVN
jgi:hypothetical protein